MGFLNRLGFNATRRTDGSIFYSQIGNQRAQLDGYTTYTAALESPILFGLIDKIAKFVAQAHFHIEGDKENKSNDPLIALLNSPNGFQSKEDFLKEFTFNYISSGYDFIAPIGSVGFEHDVTKIDSIYNLNPLYIDYNSVNFKTKLLTRANINESNEL